MATNVTIKSLYDDQPLTDRILVGIVKAARAIVTEDEQTANHPARVKWAFEVLYGGATSQLNLFRWVIALELQDTAVGSITDAQIDTVTTAIVNYIAR